MLSTANRLRARGRRSAFVPQALWSSFPPDPAAARTIHTVESPRHQQRLSRRTSSLWSSSLPNEPNPRSNDMCSSSFRFAGSQYRPSMTRQFATLAPAERLLRDDNDDDDNNNKRPPKIDIEYVEFSDEEEEEELEEEEEEEEEEDALAAATTRHLEETQPEIFVGLDDNEDQEHSAAEAPEDASTALQWREEYNTLYENDPDVQERLSRVTSRPIPGGNWNVKDPLGWAKNFGRRSRANQERLNALVHLKPGDEGYFDVSDMDIADITVVRTREQARTVVEQLYKHGEGIFHACDTEVMDIDLKNVGPVGNGYVTCMSIYSGPTFNYGLGDKDGTVLWIDNLDDACGVLQEFKGWLEDERFLKVWHNVGFDRHVLWNEGIDVQGFGGDTMHMARLHDTSREKGGGSYSLEGLTRDILKRRKKPMKEIFGIPNKRKDGSDGSLVTVPPIEVLQRDPKFRLKFIQYSCYDALGLYMLRERLMELLSKMDWLAGKKMYDYYMMHMRPFGYVLTDMERRGIRVNAKDYLASVERTARSDRARHESTFRTWVASLYPEDKKAHGLALNPASAAQLQTFLFGGAKNEKTGEITPTVREIKVPSTEIPEEAWEAYNAQLAKDREAEAAEKEAKYKDAPQNHQALAELDERLSKMKVAELKADLKSYGLKVSGKKSELIERLKSHFVEAGTPEDPIAEVLDEQNFEEMSVKELRDELGKRNIPSNGSKEELVARLRQDLEHTQELEKGVESKEATAMALIKASEDAARKQQTMLTDYLKSHISNDDDDGTPQRRKYFDLEVISLEELLKGKFDDKRRKTSLTPSKLTAGGAPSVTADVLRKLAGDPDSGNFGTAHGLLGEEGCRALFSLCSIGSIDTMIANFLTTLQELVDENSRVHGSININTETGRLSSRKPNLQNQPALEKDKYKIRKAFESSPGNNLIVADYGQLELRILASLTECKSMIEAFEAGGDFHSRTAVDMFDYIQEKVQAGEVLLEWDYADGKPTKPLVKDEYGSERRKAKTLNFSIAYGKTAHGLSQDWGVSKQEAEDMLEKWYEARPEVRDWQDKTKKTARNKGITRTLMGRYRHLPNARRSDRKLLGHAERASINTPIQGGAADIAMMAMIKINNSQKLKDLGWILLLQIHDEVILEGPEETAEEAFKEVVECMEAPWTFGLKQTSVPLLVDGSYTHKTWYEAK